MINLTNSYSGKSIYSNAPFQSDESKIAKVGAKLRLILNFPFRLTILFTCELEQLSFERTFENTISFCVQDYPKVREIIFVFHEKSLLFLRY